MQRGLYQKCCSVLLENIKSKPKNVCCTHTPLLDGVIDTTTLDMKWCWEHRLATSITFRHHKQLSRISFWPCGVSFLFLLGDSFFDNLGNRVPCRACRACETVGAKFSSGEGVGSGPVSSCLFRTRVPPFMFLLVSSFFTFFICLFHCPTPFIRVFFLLLSAAMRIRVAALASGCSQHPH